MSSVITKMGRRFMAHTGRWFGVPIAFAALRLMVLYVWWNYGPPSPVDPVRAQSGVGSLGWIAVQALVGGEVTLIVTGLTRCALPPIRWREAGLVAVVAVGADVVSGYMRFLAIGPNTTNGAEVIWTGVVFTGVLVVSGIWIRRRRGPGDGAQLRRSSD